MTAKTFNEALAEEARRGDEHRAQIRAEGWRAGYAAGLEAVAKWASERSSACIAASKAQPKGSIEEASDYFAGMEASHIARRIRSLDIPEETNDR